MALKHTERHMAIAEEKWYQANKGRKARKPKLTIIEALTKGLSSDPEDVKAMYTIKDVENKGRGVFLKAPILKKHSFVLEYEGDFISDEEACLREKIYAQNNEGCFILSFMYKGAKWAIDATRRFDSYTRLLNHSREPNIKFHAPILVELSGKGLPRLAAYALRDIHRGEEIVVDYGVTDKNLPWLKNRKAGYVSDLDSSSEEETEGHISMRISPQKNFDVLGHSSNSHISKSRNYAPESRLKPTRLVSGQNAFMVARLPLGPIERILKVLENPRKKRLKSEDVICLSASDDSTSSRQMHQYSSSCSSESSSLQRVPVPDLPHNEPCSIEKVLDWLPPEQQEIVIVDVTSLSDSTTAEYYFDNMKSDIQGITEQHPVVVIEDSEDDLPSRNLNMCAAAISPQTVNKKTVRNLAKRSPPDVCVISDDEIPHTSLPSRRPVGFPPPSAQAQVAVIKPYTATPAGPSQEETSDSQEISILDPKLTDDELKQLKAMFYCYVNSNNLTTLDVSEKISQNWPFFKDLIKRGVSANQIRFTVQQFFKPKNS